MKKILLYALAIATAVGFNGCKKKSDTLALYTLWQVTTTSQYPNLKYLQFNTDKTISLYAETNEGFRVFASSNFLQGDEQIVANLDAIEGYTVALVLNYIIDGDNLTIIGDNAQTYLTAVKSSSTAPSGWVTNVASSDKIENLFSDNNQGIGFDGTNLLLTDYDNGKIIKVSPVTRDSVGELSTINSINTVEYDGLNYWVAQNGWDKLQRLNAAGTSTFSSSSLGSWLYGIGYISSTSIIAYSGNEHTLYNYNSVTDAIVDSKLVEDANLGDIAILNSKVYVIRRYSNFIYRINPLTFAVEKTYRITDAKLLHGIANVGGNIFWLNDNNGKTLLKVTLD